MPSTSSGSSGGHRERLGTPQSLHRSVSPGTEHPLSPCPWRDALTFVGAALGSLDGQQVEDGPEPAGVAAEMGLAAPAAHPGDVGGEHGRGGGLQDRGTRPDGDGDRDGEDGERGGGSLTSWLFFTASFRALRGSSGSVQFLSQPSRVCR